MRHNGTLCHGKDFYDGSLQAMSQGDLYDDAATASARTSTPSPKFAQQVSSPEGLSVRAMRGLETKYRISEVAMALFLEHGYDNVTVEMVAAAAQVSRRTIFRYFKGKTELPFPDHTERVALLADRLEASPPSESAVEAVFRATEATLVDFLERPELVVRRYQLTRVVPELREREVVEHERYVVVSRGYLRDHLPPEAPPFEAMALASLIDAMHRSALGNFARTNGSSDALAELRSGIAWVRELLEASSSRHPGMLLALVPDTASTRRALVALRADSSEID